MKVGKSEFEVKANIGFNIFLLIKLDKRDGLLLLVLCSTKIISAIENPGVTHVTGSIFDCPLGGSTVTRLFKNNEIWFHIC